MTNPERIARLAKDFLQKNILGEITIGSADFSPLSGVRLRDVTIRELSGRGSDDPSQQVDMAGGELFSCELLELAHDPLDMLSGKLTIRSIIAHKPHCSIIRDVTLGRTNLSGILAPMESASAEELAELPTFELRGARLSVTQSGEDGGRLIEDMTLTVRGRPSVDGPPAYHITWQDQSTSTSGHSIFDLTRMSLRNVSGGLPWMSIEAVMVVVDAKYDGAGGWCDLLGLAGRVRAQDYNVTSAMETGSGRFVTIELHNASISIPVSEVEDDLPPDQRYLRFDRVDGTMKITGDGLEADFAGLFHNSPCEVTAKLRAGAGEISTLNDVDIEAEFSLANWRIPRFDPGAEADEVRFIRRWPPIEWVYSRFEPEGDVSVRASLSKRAGVDQPVELEYAHLSLLTGSACCAYFPYPGDCVTGMIEITPDGVYVRDLTALHGEERFTVNAYLAHPMGRSIGHIQVEALDAPLDDDLYLALDERSRRMWDLFHPTGHADVAVSLDLRPAGEGMRGKWGHHVRAEFDDLAATYAGFPYPLTQATGHLEISEGLVEAQLSGRHGEGAILAAGHAISKNRQLLDASFDIDARNIKLDEALVSALPVSLGDTVARFHASGTIDAEIDLEWDSVNGALRSSTHLLFDDLAFKHEEFPVALSNVSGTLVITPEFVEIEGVKARRGDGSVAIHGRHSLGREPVDTVLNIQCEGVLLDEELRSALPDSVAGALADWDVRGGFDTHTDLRFRPGDTGRRVEAKTTARLVGVDVRHARFPIAFENVCGVFTADAGQVGCPSLTGRYGDAEFELAFGVAEAAHGEDGWISLTAEGLKLDQNLRDALPDALRSRWDRLASEGAVDVRLDNLSWHHPSAEPTTVEVDGELTLRDVSIPGLVSLKHGSGVIEVDGMLLDRLGGTNLGGRLRLRAVEAFDLHLNDVTTSWRFAQTADGRGLVSIPSLHAQLYEGTVDADVELDLVPKEVRYDINAVARQVNMEPFLSEDLLAGQQQASGTEAKGWIDARVTLSGKFGDDRSRRGVGGLRIIDGRIYRMPIMLAILNFLNPATPPDPNAFNYVDAKFSIKGNRMGLKDIVLHGSPLRLKGTGSMSLVDRHVDLSLKGDGAWPHIPVVSDMVGMVSSGLVELHVTGPLSQPTVKARTLPKVNTAIKDLFKKKRTRSRPERPSG